MIISNFFIGEALNGLSGGTRLFLYLLLVVSPTSAQDWMLLAVGNQWEYLNDAIDWPGSPSNTASRNYSIVSVDSQFNYAKHVYYRVTTKYFFPTPTSSYTLMRYDNSTQTFFVGIVNDSETVFADFGDTIGYQFGYGVEWRTITAGYADVFDSVRNYRGYNSAWIYGNGFSRYVQNIGKYYGYSYFRGVGHEQEGSESLVQTIIHTDSTHVQIYSYHYIPTFGLTPVKILTNFNLKLDLAVGHPYSVNGFDFVDSVTMYSNYSKGALRMDRPALTLQKNAGTSMYTISQTLDSVLLKEGCSFNYRFEAKDKSLVPRYGHAPDSGYYSAFLDPRPNIIKTITTNKTGYVYGDIVHITIRAINPSSTQDTLSFPDARGPYPYVDNNDYRMTFGLESSPQTTLVIMPPNGSLEWNYDYPDSSKPAMRLTEGPHTLFGYFRDLYSNTPSIGIYVKPATDKVENKESPTEFSLLQNYPNPFNSTTTIEFTVPSADRAALTIIDVLGREVAVVFHDNVSAGRHTARWNATNCSSGIYFYDFQTKYYRDRKKLVLVK